MRTEYESCAIPLPAEDVGGTGAKYHFKGPADWKQALGSARWHRWALGLCLVAALAVTALLVNPRASVQVAGRRVNDIREFYSGPLPTIVGNITKAMNGAKHGAKHGEKHGAKHGATHGATHEAKNAEAPTYRGINSHGEWVHVELEASVQKGHLYGWHLYVGPKYTIKSCQAGYAPCMVVAGVDIYDKRASCFYYWRGMEDGCESTFEAHMRFVRPSN